MISVANPQTNPVVVAVAWVTVPIGPAPDAFPDGSNAGINGPPTGVSFVPAYVISTGPQIQARTIEVTEKAMSSIATANGP
jgi:hypothetical protein